MYVTFESLLQDLDCWWHHEDVVTLDASLLDALDALHVDIEDADEAWVGTMGCLSL